MKILQELNHFCEATTIHGFAYISQSQKRSTRIIWTLVVLVAAGVTSYETVGGFDDKYVSTTIQTKDIKKYPFPAVTFSSGDFNSKKSFRRNFLNEFHFTRYHNNCRANRLNQSIYLTCNLSSDATDRTTSLDSLLGILFISEF